MKIFGLSGLLGFSLALASTASYSAPKTCASLLRTDGVTPRQLYVLPASALLEQDKSLKRQSLSLAYIIPAHAYSSGVVILKVRHRVITTTPPPDANPKIAMSRTAYRTPCAGPAGSGNAGVLLLARRGAIQKLSSLQPARRPDGSRTRRLGNRPKGWWGERDNRCVSTSSWDIRPQLLFEDNSERHVIGFGDYASNRVATALRSTNVNSTAVAAPVAYSDYRDLAVRIIPYRKAPDQPFCVNISVDPGPATASWTEVMIIDADDARYPRDPLADPQKSWRFQWN